MKIIRTELDPFTTNIPLRTLNVVGRAITSPWRKLPSFIIIGAQKAGTTFLFNLLLQHPNIAPPAWKEINYFNKHWRKPTFWYKAQFPSILKAEQITGEATPRYFFNPHVPQRIKHKIPQAKIILLKRNPTELAYSLYQLRKRKGKETRTFEEAINRELAQLATYQNPIDYFDHPDFDKNSYVYRGLYDYHIQNWRQHFADEDFLILEATDLFKQSLNTYRQVTEFLNLTDFEPAIIRNPNKGSYTPMSADIKQVLDDYFAKHNAGAL